MGFMARGLPLTLAVIAVTAAGVRAGQDFTRAEADQMAQKLAAIEARGNTPAHSGTAPLRTSFTDREVNAYFRYNGKERLPDGVVDPQMTIQSDSRVDVQAVVDLDAVRKSQQSWMAGLLHGSVEVRVSGSVAVSNGKGTLQILTASFGGIPIPPSLLQDVVGQYTKTPDLPSGFQLDKPFDLPANIREVRLQHGAATIIQ
jgi:hypothetical protein